MATMAKAKANGLTSIVELPISEPCEDRYCSRHVEVGALTRPQAHVLRRLRTALDGSGAKLESGRFVRSAADVLRYMLEKVGAGLDED